MGSSYIFKKKPLVTIQPVPEDKDISDRRTSSEDSVLEKQDDNDVEAKMTFDLDPVVENKPSAPPVFISYCKHDTVKIPTLHDIVEENCFLDVQIKSKTLHHSFCSIH